jgi:tRNA(Ile)-lysidine synthase
MEKSVVWPGPGKYILAVSGGADSMVLMHIFARQSHKAGFQLIVAHFDHGMREESTSDRKFVARAATRLTLPFVYAEGKLGNGSEAVARDARLGWLESMRIEHGAVAIATAHHADDLLETSILNLSRGSGRRGLAPMQDGPILRPLIRLTRSQLRDFAKAHQITWQEDQTNADISNPRNFLRHNLLPQTTPDWTTSYLENVRKLAKLNKLIDQSISEILLSAKDGENAYNFPRALVQDLSISEFEEVLISAAGALQPGTEVSRRIVQELSLFAKTSSARHHRALRRGLEVSVFTDSVRITS